LTAVEVETVIAQPFFIYCKRTLFADTKHKENIMAFMIVERPAKKLVSYRVVGPYENTIKEGFRYLMAWSERHHQKHLEWLTLYHDNPNITPGEKLRADTSVCVADNFILDDAEGLALQTLPGGTYAAYHTTIADGNFAKAWTDFYAQYIANSGYRPDGKACFEHYLNDGSENGVWEVVFYQHVEKIPTIR
jgi:DNA gyrase inhibitor